MAEQEKTAIGEATANRERSVQVANQNAESESGQKMAERDKGLKSLNLKQKVLLVKPQQIESRKWLGLRNRLFQSKEKNKH